MKLIDAHHHFWDPDTNYHPWLRDDPPIDFRYGDYRAIRQRFMPNEYDTVTENWDVVASITMEGEWDRADPTGEAIWMQDLHNKTGRPAAHVAQIWLDRNDLENVLEVYRSLPIVRSVRHKPRAQVRPDLGYGGMSEAPFLSGFEKLHEAGLMFDLQTPWWHLKEVANLRERCEYTPIILNHCGLPNERSAEGLTRWRQAIENFARLPNTYIKISGLGLLNQPWSIHDNREIIMDIIDIFGPQRAMMASNFPVDRLCGSFDVIFHGFDEATRHLCDSARAELFFNTASRVYGLDKACAAGKKLGHP